MPKAHTATSRTPRTAPERFRLRCREGTAGQAPSTRGSISLPIGLTEGPGSRGPVRRLVKVCSPSFSSVVVHRLNLVDSHRNRALPRYGTKLAGGSVGR